VLPGPGITFGHRLERKAAGDIDQRMDRAEMRRDSVDGLFGLNRVGKIDAADIDPIFCRSDLCRCVIHAGDARTPRQRHFRNDLAQRARSAGDDNDFSVHD